MDNSSVNDDTLVNDASLFLYKKPHLTHFLYNQLIY